MATYTVTEALVKLKLAKKKIDDAVASTLTGVVVTSGAKVAPAGFKNLEEFSNEIKKRLDSANGLVNFRDRLKKAIVESNARTNVTVGAKVMTVAEAIEAKNGIESKKLLLGKLVGEWRALENMVAQKNSGIEAKADQYVTQLFAQNTGAKDEDKANARQNFIVNNTAVIATNPIVRNYIESLKAEIEDFEANVDVALSVVNATTKVTVED